MVLLRPHKASVIQ